MVLGPLGARLHRFASVHLGTVVFYLWLGYHEILEEVNAVKWENNLFFFLSLS